MAAHYLSAAYVVNTFQAGHHKILYAIPFVLRNGIKLYNGAFTL